MRLAALFLTFASSVISSAAFAHEFWLEPLNYQVENGETLQAQLFNGESFEGVEQAYLPQNFALFSVVAGDLNAPVTGRLGDMPALQQVPLAEGLHVVAYQSGVSTVNYEEFESFLTFATHKDFAGIAYRHGARSLPEVGFTEAYSRFVKTLIAVGEGQGSDTRIGLEAEIVALNNPYTDDISDGMQVQLFYKFETRNDAQVEMFAKAPDGTVEVTLHRTNDQGIALLPVQPGYTYLLDAVLLRTPSPELASASEAVWETLWASMTFAVPE